ncbi:universal stress protein [Amycolatopsis methanolica]|uniref:universal stress protein n=1 Tax=Amycolatopsis methanolica TaxID=1814 RepID=UPI0034128FF0
MAVLVAVTDSDEGTPALDTAVAEARRRRTGLLAANLRLAPLDTSHVPDDVETTVLEREPDVEVGQHVLGLLDRHRDEVDLLVIGMKRRSPVGKLVLGSLAQFLLLNADVPVLAPKTPG